MKKFEQYYAKQLKLASNLICYMVSPDYKINWALVNKSYGIIF